eukprot:5380188-Prymnesium_polylepis.2
MKEATDYSVLFSGACADDNGVTAERTTFAKALEPLGIKIIKWSDDPEKPRKGVPFPPYIKEVAQRECPAMLLEFCNR